MYIPRIQYTMNHSSVMQELRHPTTTRVFSSLSVFFFTFVFYFAPFAQAIAQQQPQNSNAAEIIHKKENASSRMNSGLLRLKNVSKQKSQNIKIKPQKLSTNELREFQDLANELEQEHTNSMSDFEAIENDLIDQGFSDVILQRHYDTVDRYEAAFFEMWGKLQTVLTASSLSAQKTALGELEELMNNHKLNRSHQKTDPNKLPWKTPDSKTRNPGEIDEVVGSLEFEEPLMVAANLATADMLAQPGGPTADDLTETVEVVFSDAIRAKALELNEDPIEIYEWVRNSIEFVPSYGSIQGADYTMKHGKGNAFDTASLLIALLRSAKIPARYAIGTVELPAPAAMNWVGGVDVPEAAQQLMGQGGIPNTAIVSGGKISHIRFETTWVEAWVDYFPSRGTNHIVGDTWIPMDASFKQYHIAPGFDINHQVVLDTQGLIDNLNQAASVNVSEGYIQGVDQAQIEAALLEHEQNVTTYVENKSSAATLGEVVGTSEVRNQEFYQLPASLPYKLKSRISSLSTLPDELRHKFKLSIQESTGGFYGGFLSDVVTKTFSLPALAGDFLSVSFAPATENDRLLMKRYLPTASSVDELPGSIPGYLINVSAEMNVNGEAIITAGSIPFGTELNYQAEIYTPNRGWERTDASGIAGEYRAIGIDLQGVSEHQLDTVQASLKAVDQAIIDGDTSSLDKHDLIGAITQANILAYFAANDTANYFQSELAGVIDLRLPSYGYFVNTLTPIYNFGIPRTVNFTGVTMDVPYLRGQSYAIDNDKDKWVAYNRAKGVRASFLENWIPEQYFGTVDNPVEGVSAVKLLHMAMKEGQKIFTLTSSNESSLAQVNIDDDARQDIRNALRAGKEVTVHESPATVGGWNGSGYLIIDPSTGAGGYLISGGANGGSVEDEFVAKFLHFFNSYGIELNAGEASGLLLFGSIPKSWIGASPLLGSKNPLTSVLRALSSTIGKIPFFRSFLIPASTLAGTFIGFYNVTIMTQALIYAAL